MTQDQYIAHHNQMGWAYWIASACFAGIALGLKYWWLIFFVGYYLFMARDFWRKYAVLRFVQRKEQGDASPDS